MWVLLPGLIIECIGVILLIVAILADSFLGIIASICVMVLAVGIHIFQIKKTSRLQQRGAAMDKPDPSMPRALSDDSMIVYSDRLVTITENAITFKNYSLLLRPRRVNFLDIDHIDVLEPSLTTGKYRMWGSGNFTMWYPMDSGRASRDKIFHAYLKIHGMNVGFTVENSLVVTAILRSKGLITSSA